MGDTHFDPTGEKKARKQATFRGAVICGVFNAILGLVLGFCVLAATSPQEYKPKPDAKTGKIPPPPAGIYYWAGAPGGDYTPKESQFLTAQPGGVTVTDGELNSWASGIFKTAPKRVAAKPAPKPDAANGTSDVAKAKEEVNAAEADLRNFGITAGTPNFHIFKDPDAPADVPLSFQIAVPMTITLAGLSADSVYQARGVFTTGANGPRFQPYLSYFGSARIPGLFGGTIFRSFLSKFAAADAAKKYADAWAKLASATIQDGGLVLASK